MEVLIQVEAVSRWSRIRAQAALAVRESAGIGTDGQRSDGCDSLPSMGGDRAMRGVPILHRGEGVATTRWSYPVADLPLWVAIPPQWAGSNAETAVGFLLPLCPARIWRGSGAQERQLSPMI